MLLRQMRYFVAVVEANSFTEAAEQCFISQSAISQQIRALEQELGVQLIHRENRRFSLTPAGEYFYNHAKPILAQAEALMRETRRLGEDDELVLRIGYLRCYSGLELHQAIAEFSALYPEVRLSIENGTHEALYDLLRPGEVDLILSDQRRAFSDVYENLVLAQGGIFAELSLNHPLSQGASVSLEALSTLPCILITDKDQADNERTYYQNTLGFGPSFLFADNLEEARLMAVGGRGYLPLEQVGTLPAVSAGLCRLPVLQNGHPILRSYCAFWRKDRSTYYIEEFAAILKRLLAQA